jgi:hypothetical protein
MATQARRAARVERKSTVPEPQDAVDLIAVMNAQARGAAKHRQTRIFKALPDRLRQVIRHGQHLVPTMPKSDAIMDKIKAHRRRSAA